MTQILSRINLYALKRSVPWLPLAFALSATLAWYIERLDRSRHSGQQVQYQLRIQELEKISAKATLKPPAGGWSNSLPIVVPVSSILSRTRQVAEASSVTVLSISVGSQAATTATLGRLSMDLDLRGSYSAVKDFLSEVMTQEAGEVLVQSVSYRRRGTSSELDTRVQFIWPTRPSQHVSSQK